MKIVLQRVTHASVVVDNNLVAEIEKGYLIFLGVHIDDTNEDLEWMVKKIIGMRVFNDDQQRMNLSIKDIDGSILIVSQFTLYASTKKGNRPSFIKAARPDKANTMYRKFCDRVSEENIKVEMGQFGADMKVSLLNDGPVTIILDSKSKV